MEEPHRETNIPYEGQLEPTTRYMIKKICQKDSDELQILMLCTNKTIESTDNFAQKTAIDFFKDRIDWCKGKISVEYIVEKHITISLASISLLVNK